MNDIVLGEIQVQGPIHNDTAINTLVYLYASPSDWRFVQFVSQAQLDQFAQDNGLVVRKKE